MTDDTDNIVKLPVRKHSPRAKELTLVGARPCEHIHLEVDESRELLTCLDCKQTVTPMWALARLARKESLWAWNREQYLAASRRHDARTRTKCQHCGKLTRISR